jgi:hypothetical protein
MRPALALLERRRSLIRAHPVRARYTADLSSLATNELSILLASRRPRASEQAVSDLTLSTACTSLPKAITQHARELEDERH